MMDINQRLHIEELKEKFKEYRIISMNDFYEFYKEVFGDIKRNTVNWYIYELKKMGLIRNISRGQYVLEDTDRDEGQEYIVITMDIIKSTILDYQEFNHELERKVLSLNTIIKDAYGCERTFNIFQGDEIQILLPLLEYMGELIMLTLSFLYPFKVRYGIGVGELNGEIKQNSWEMNGPIFWNARDQLEKIKNVTDYKGLIMSGYNKTDYSCNNILPLINRTISNITGKQWEAIKHELSKQSLEKVLKNIGISKTSYYDRLKLSNIDEILSSFRTIYDLIKMRRIIK